MELAELMPTQRNQIEFDFISKMKFIEDPTEQTTALTDLILALIATGGILFLRWDSSAAGAIWKLNIWSTAIGLIGFAAVLGAVAHGLIISRTARDRIWLLLNVSLALAVSFFVVGVVYDLWGLTACLKALPAMLMASLFFGMVTLRYPGIFFVFIIYEGMALMFALGAYIFLAVRGELDGAEYIAAGILISIIAAAIQTNKSIALTIIRPFDHNGIYHILQMIGLLFLVYGLRSSMK